MVTGTWYAAANQLKHICNAVNICGAGRKRGLQIAITFQTTKKNHHAHCKGNSGLKSTAY